MIRAETLARALVGESLRTPRDARANVILRVEADQIIVSTTRSPDGQPVPMRMLQDVLDRLGTGEAVPIDPRSIGRRSSFLGAVLLTLPMVEIPAEGAPVARLRAGAVPRQDVLVEFENRLAMYANLLEQGGATGVRPDVIRHIGIYGGASGVWTDTARTRGIGNAPAVTVGLLHTGRHYADDLSADAVLYHYPQTDRPPGRDAAEIEATRQASILGLPVFVILQEGSKRSVRRGWVVSWDDREQLFLVEFGPLPTAVSAGDAVDVERFELFEEREEVFRRTRGRPNQQRFKLRVLQRYGGHCALCDSPILEWLDAAHLVAEADRGSSDPRNGIPLCKNHHTAFDLGLVAIDLDGVIYLRNHTSSELGITRDSLDHLRAQPAVEALRYRWERRTRGEWIPSDSAAGDADYSLRDAQLQ